MGKRNFFRSYGFGICLIFLTCLIVEIMGRAGWLGPMERTYYDFWHQIAGKRSQPQHVAIVSVDNQTLLEHRDEPMVFWGPHFARAIEVLRNVGVRCIGMDFLFSVSIESWLRKLDSGESELSRTYDIPMRVQLNKGNVVLIANLAVNDRGRMETLLPVNDYLYSLPGGINDVALANLYLDDDGVVRMFVPMLFQDGRQPSITFGAMMAKQAIGNGLVPPVQLTGDDPVFTDSKPYYIGYNGPPGTVPRVSFLRLLAENAEQDPAIKNLKDKIVIVSAEHAGTGNDIHPTPYVQNFISRGRGLMTGAEIQSNIVETILTGKHPLPLPDAINIIFLVIFVTAGTIAFLKLSPLKGFVALVILGLLSSAIAYVLFLDGRVMPSGNVHIALGLGYIGALGRRLTSEEKRRSQLQRVFGSYVSDSVVETVLNSGEMPDLGGKTYYVSVLFSDIRSFTTISEKLKPDEVVEMLNRYFTQACEPILDQGGMVDKFIGDAVMAIFGAPVAYPDQARRCLLAAVEMDKIARNFQHWLKQRFPDRGLPDFRIGIGVHTGEAVIGNIGSPKKMGYTSIGDTVNIASRLESMCKKLGWTIVISRETAAAAGNDLVIGKTDTVTPTGRTGQIEVLELLDINNHKGGKP